MGAGFLLSGHLLPPILGQLLPPILRHLLPPILRQLLPLILGHLLSIHKKGKYINNFTNHPPNILQEALDKATDNHKLLPKPAPGPVRGSLGSTLPTPSQSTSTSDRSSWPSSTSSWWRWSTATTSRPPTPLCPIWSTMPRCGRIRSSAAENDRRPLKNYNGEKLDKCYLCDFASSRSFYLTKRISILLISHHLNHSI